MSKVYDHTSAVVGAIVETSIIAGVSVLAGNVIKTLMTGIGASNGFASGAGILVSVLAAAYQAESYQYARMSRLLLDDLNDRQKEKVAKVA